MHCRTSRACTGRIAVLAGIGRAQPHRLRPAADHAHQVPHRYLPEDLLRHRQLRTADAGDLAGLHPDLCRTGRPGAPALA
ncbi:hypothetical protein G6F55_014597 [Rhizopus delemar]|nr:hypothetical protein G6F55_014597 [Rhizopus delemar]